MKQDPYLDAGVRGWIMNTARKEFWRVAPWYEFEDLIQDGYLCYAKCRSRFVPMYDTPTPSEDDRKRFMAYFTSAFRNHIIDLACQKTQTPEMAVASLSEAQVGKVEAWWESAADLSDANLAALIMKAPAEIMELLRQILVDGLGETPYQKTRLREKTILGSKVPRVVKGRRAVRETTAQHYDRCLGQSGVIQKLRDYFLPRYETQKGEC